VTLVNPYCTVEDIRGQLSDKDAKVDDVIVERAINATSRAVDHWCGRRFWQDATVKIRTYRVTDYLCARVDDISTTAGLLVATDTGGDGVFETSWTINTDFFLEPLNADADGPSYAWWDLVACGSKRFPIYRTSPRPALQVTAKFGWASIPPEVEQAAVLRAVAIFKRKESPQGVAGFGDFGAIRISRQDPDVLALLAPFQRPMVA
jgi:hypothetical protein